MLALINLTSDLTQTTMRHLQSSMQGIVGVACPPTDLLFLSFRREITARPIVVMATYLERETHSLVLDKLYNTMKFPFIMIFRIKTHNFIIQFKSVFDGKHYNTSQTVDRLYLVISTHQKRLKIIIIKDSFTSYTVLRSLYSCLNTQCVIILAFIWQRTMILKLAITQIYVNTYNQYRSCITNQPKGN